MSDLTFDPPPDNEEIWTTQDGRKIPVGEMDIDHLRNTLRMLIRKGRERAQRKLLKQLYDDLPVPDESFYERPDNHQQLANLRAKHGDAVRVVPESVAGMSGANVYVGDRKVGWFGGIG